ncbi:MAG: ankyrin repeat domain-containing protein [Smithellaceae bacterium]|nr:ankyrin repeat domain-containing protein [Smithellaceae bacterium]
MCVTLSACATGGSLHVASGQGNLKAMEAALNAGADPNEHKGKMTNIIDGWTPAGWGGPPLHHAAYYCQDKAAALLIAKGADVNALGGGDLTALHRAAFRDCEKVIRLLLENGANINARDAVYRDGYTPLEWAALAGARRAVRALVENGADPEAAIFKIKTGNQHLDKSLHPEAALQLLSVFAGQNKRTGQAAEPKGTPEGIRPAIVSDIDELPSAKATPDKKAYAIVIGIERYRQSLPRADFADRDAAVVVKYLENTLGYPGENIITLTNDRALQSDFAKYFEKWLPNHVEPGSRVFIYYSGHGAPDPKTGGAYLVPYDGDPTFITETGYSLNRMYAALGKLPAKEIIVVLDSCFSGSGGRSVLARGARPLVMNLQTATVLPKNMTVMAASSGEQISSTYHEKGHGLFTYFLLKGIKDGDVLTSDGALRMDDLYGYVKPQVERIARRQYNNEQTPQLIRGK